MISLKSFLYDFDRHTFYVQIVCAHCILCKMECIKCSSTNDSRIGQLTTASCSCLFFPECLCKYQQNHVSGEPPGGGRSLRLHTDKADLRSAGSGLEKFCRCAWRALHHPCHVVGLSPEGWTGEIARNSNSQRNQRAELGSWADSSENKPAMFCWKKNKK